MDAILNPHASSAPTDKDIVAEANHRIANSLALLVSMVRMQASAAYRRGESIPPGEARLMLEGVAARISTIGHLHRLLSRAPQDGATLLMPHLREVSDSLVAALSSSQQPVSVLLAGEDCTVLTRQVQPLILILCEIFINAMKYAHPTGVPLVMQVDCMPAADGRLVLTIRDDGIGLPEGFNPAADGGLGMRVIRSLAAEAGAMLEITSDDLGLSFRFSMPAAAMSRGKVC